MEKDEDHWAKYKPGAIVSIELCNFMIYKNFKLTPGPFLNLLLGPNGSGKSAVVCAIIMGFGGDPQVTGRSSNLIDYIRFGQQQAIISIEVYSGSVSEPNSVIQRHLRVLTRNGKNECTNIWKLNGRTVNKQDIASFVKALNIDINNLCQVLPQERVVEFSRLSPKELLVSTEKSIGDIHMYERHMKLISLSHQIEELQQKIKDCNAFILKYQNFKSNMEPDLKLIKQRKKFEEEIKWLTKKKVWIEFESLRTLYTQTKEEFARFKEEYQLRLNKIKPLRAQLDNCEKCFQTIKSQKSKSSVVSKQFFSKMNSFIQKQDQFQDEIGERISTFNEKLHHQRKLKDKLAKAEQDLSNYRSELLNYNNQEQFEAQLKFYKEELQKLDEETRQVMRDIGAKRAQIENLNSEMRLLNNKKTNLNSVFTKQIEKVSYNDNTLQKTCEWLDKNRDKFVGEVFYPIITQINVKRKEWIHFVEASIGTQDLSTFLFESVDDLRLFCSELEKDLKIRVNVAVVPSNVDVQQYKTAFDIEQYKQFGIFSSISELFTAPAKVMIYLCKNYHLHELPVGNEKTEQRIQALLESSPFRRIITHKNLYQITSSIYDNTKSTRIKPLKGARFLDAMIDQNQVKKVEEEMRKVQKTMAETHQALEEANKKNQDLRELYENKHEQYESFRSKQNGVSLLEAKIKNQERIIKQLKESATSVDSLKVDIAKDLTTTHGEQLRVLDKMGQAAQLCVDSIDSELLSDLKLEVLSKLRRAFERVHAAAVEEERSKRFEYKTREESLRRLRDEAKKLRDHAKDVSGFDFSDAAVQQDQLILDKFNAMPSSVEEIESSINVFKLRCEGIHTIDESILEQYQKLQADIAEKSQQCANLEQELANMQKEIDTIKPLWFNALEALVQKINENFSNFMAYLNYSGEVYLFSGGKELAFEEYGIRIKVKFRDSEPMKDLDAYHQSGGERSVSTMVFMLSLQELANVPFRVVDEINQGMDEKNERCIFDLIAEVSRKNSSQYFLISPKLLSNLNYTEDMTVHIIYNARHCFVDWRKVVENIVSKKAD